MTFICHLGLVLPLLLRLGLLCWLHAKCITPDAILGKLGMSYWSWVCLFCWVKILPAYISGWKFVFFWESQKYPGSPGTRRVGGIGREPCSGWEHRPPAPRSWCGRKPPEGLPQALWTTFLAGLFAPVAHLASTGWLPESFSVFCP